MITLALRHDYPTLSLDITFSAPTPGTTMLFGPSGSGKSTTIAAIAGLLRADQLRVSLDDEVLADTSQNIFIPPEKRRIGLVFQDARLFPHLDVMGNLAYGFRRAPQGPFEFDGVIDLLGLEDLLKQRPHTLSGGQKQRVAIGRALLSQPRLLLLDEPLASLDRARRHEILPYLQRIKHQRNLPIVYVTHSMAEVTLLADTLVLLDRGRVQTAGPLSAITSDAAMPTALRDDAGSVLRMRIVDHDAYTRLTRLQSGRLVLDVPLQAERSGFVRVRVPAREVILAQAAMAAISINNTIPGRVRKVVEDVERNIALVEVLVGDDVILARVTRNAVTRLGLQTGAAVMAMVKSSSIEVMDGVG